MGHDIGKAPLKESSKAESSPYQGVLVNYSDIPTNVTYPDDWKITYPERGPFRTRDVCLVVCTGRSVWDDVKASNWDKGSGMDIMCVKDSFLYFPGNVMHAVSEHPNQLSQMNQLRQFRPKMKKFRTAKPLFHTAKGGDRFVHAWGFPEPGCSGLMGVIVALLLGYPRIILAGCPLDSEGHFYDPPWYKSTNLERSFNQTSEGPRWWNKYNKMMFDNKVRAMSGRLRDYLGGPDDR
jgi:hypothetical protein